jgi:hypothetical protein
MISFIKKDGTIADVTVIEPSVVVNAVITAATHILFHPNGGKVLTIKFLRANLHPELHPFLSLRVAIDMIESLQRDRSL